MVTGQPYSSLETNFQISKTELLSFFPKFLTWFLKEYYTMYVGGLSGVGFDTYNPIFYILYYSSTYYTVEYSLYYFLCCIFYILFFCILQNKI